MCPTAQPATLHLINLCQCKDALRETNRFGSPISRFTSVVKLDGCNLAAIHSSAETFKQGIIMTINNALASVAVK